MIFPARSGLCRGAIGLITAIFFFQPWVTNLAAAAQETQPAGSAIKSINELAFGDEDIQKIAAIVNDNPITEYDVYQRLALMVSQAGFQLTEEDVAQMREQVLRSLIDESLKIEEANSFEVRPETGEVDAQLQEIAMQNNMTVHQIESTLAKQNIRLFTLKRQLAAEIVWGTIVQGRFGNSISVTEEEINAVYQRSIANANKPQYHIFEIQIRVDSPDQEEEIRNGMLQLRQQIMQGADFRSVAQQISHSPTAAKGGDVGWVQDGQLSPNLNLAIRNLNPGDISGPIRTASSYYMLMLAERRIIGGANPLEAKVTMRQLVFPLAEGTPQDQIQGAGSYLLQASQVIKTCDDLDALKEKFPTGQLSEVQSMTIGDVGEVFQSAIIPLQAGEASAPILTNQGFHIIVVCEREDVGTSLPDRDQIENQLANQQLIMMARRYLRDLRNDAVVELR